MIEWLAYTIREGSVIWQAALDTPAVLIGVFALLGAMVGSFMNVVIHRLPIMMREEGLAIAYCEYPGLIEKSKVDEVYRGENLFRSSRAPCCDVRIKWYQNIPLLSWVALKGRCGACGSRIRARYLTIETAMTVVFGIEAWTHQADPVVGVWSGLVIGTLLCVAVIDGHHKLIPDPLNVMMAILMLVSVDNGLSPYTSSMSTALASAFGVYALLTTVNWWYIENRNVVAIGGGDIKLAAALALFFGFQLTLIVMLVAMITFFIWSKFKQREGEQALGVFISPAAVTLWLITLSGGPALPI